ncbi:MAG: methyl-accepting chemotaxis protein, partial [Spirochaetota bacterium]|nr:methyl-accepting chemotaxis protein [Spirochaetota bacterium]
MEEIKKQSMTPHKFGISFKINLAGLVLFIPTFLLLILDIFEITPAIKQNRTMLIPYGLFIILLSVIFFLLVKRSIIKSISHLRESIHNASIKDFTDKIPVEINDELGKCQTEFNSLIEIFSFHIIDIQKSNELFTGLLDKISNSLSEILSISNEKTNDVSKIVSTMEETDSLSKQLAISIKEINRITIEMKKSFLIGFDLIKKSLLQMEEIGKSNQETLDGIIFLGEKIENIWDIINIINGIADQTKIIAFNAELEASAAGEAGKNFRIVASEIRRLADSTVNSTNAIKSRITEIQHSSDTLIVSSEQGTERIKEGIELSSNLQNVFEDVLYSTEITSTSTSNIQDSITKQVNSYEMILETLKAIFEGVSNLSTISNVVLNDSKDLYSTTNKLNESFFKFQLITP